MNEMLVTWNSDQATPEIKIYQIVYTLHLNTAFPQVIHFILCYNNIGQPVPLFYTTCLCFAGAMHPEDEFPGRVRGASPGPFWPEAQHTVGKADFGMVAHPQPSLG
jgi:hypothetical protein